MTSIAHGGPQATAATTPRDFRVRRPHRGRQLGWRIAVSVAVLLAFGVAVGVAVGYVLVRALALVNLGTPPWGG